ncbi:MAG TPA: NAD-dependent epimerase/dehydratase family protein [Gemmatimonadaceae bacterium]|nr:NAD-dependent epimerase/dehydratase family protein [Gemmatimonadaceae bacterium]
MVDGASGTISRNDIVLVTGAAGFIGSHLCDALVARGERVVGLDDFNPYYDPALKRRNIEQLSGRPGFTLIEGDISSLGNDELDALIARSGVVYHLAAQVGVRASWDDFNSYVIRNITLTHRLLEAARRAISAGGKLQRFVLASTSSIYGDAEDLPTAETAPPRPVSPYGVTKLAAERLALLYAANFNVPVTALRLFSVYGPRQRPDMGFNIFFDSVLKDAPIEIFGDGNQTRDFTYVSDVIAAMLAAATADGVVGEVINVGGGHRVSLTEVLDVIENVVGRSVDRKFTPPMKGDARHTAAEISKAGTLLGYAPAVSMTEGLRAEWEWMRDQAAAGQRPPRAPREETASRQL